jgi:hypothetical protein
MLLISNVGPQLLRRKFIDRKIDIDNRSCRYPTYSVRCSTVNARSRRDVSKHVAEKPKYWSGWWFVYWPGRRNVDWAGRWSIYRSGRGAIDWARRRTVDRARWGAINRAGRGVVDRSGWGVIHWARRRSLNGTWRWSFNRARRWNVDWPNALSEQHSTLASLYSGTGEKRVASICKPHQIPFAIGRLAKPFLRHGRTRALARFTHSCLVRRLSRTLMAPFM